ncbi:MAG: RNA methyltransferase substrate-binding domain-containing protein, partial [bacterium]
MAKKAERANADASADVEAESVVCGFHAVQSLLARAPAEVIEVLLDPRRRDARATRLRRELAQSGTAFRAAEVDELARRAGRVKHQGVLARMRRRASSDESELHALLDDLARPALLLILDQVQDPHNLGA